MNMKLSNNGSSWILEVLIKQQRHCAMDHIHKKQVGNTRKNWNWKFRFWENFFQLQYWYQNWTLVSVPPTKTWFRLYTKPNYEILIRGRFFCGNEPANILQGSCDSNEVSCFSVVTLSSYLELVSKELNHFGEIAGLFRQIWCHTWWFVLFALFEDFLL